MKIYAAYKGDTFLIVDTLEAVAKFLNVKKDTVLFYASPAAQKRNKSGDNIHVFRV